MSSTADAAKGLIVRRGLTAVLVIVASAVLAGSAIAKGLGTFGDGVHRVGSGGIAAGTYRSLGGDGCYWARLKSFSGSLGSILANENASGPTLATILRTDRGFQTQGCGKWTSNLSRITKSMTRFGQGQYIVRVDIAPGTYRARGGDGCYWERERNFTGGLSALIANDNVTGQAVVTISRTDKGFKSSGCGTWTRF